MTTAFRRLLFLVFFIGVFLLLWKFVEFNTEPLQLRFFSFRTLEAPAGLIVLLCFLAGLLVSSFLFFSIVVSTRLERRRLIREAESLQKLLSQQMESAKKLG